MGQVYRMKLSENALLYSHEEKILCRYANELILPLSIVRDEFGEYIDFLVDGHVVFNRYNFSNLGSVFAVLTSLVEFYISVQKHLLDPFRFFSEKEKILICCENMRAVPLFGKERRTELGLSHHTYIPRNRNQYISQEIMQGDESQGYAIQENVSLVFPEKEVDLILPVLIELSRLNAVVCAKDAMESIYNKIRGTNPGLKDILRIVRDTQREWNLIMPTGFYS